MNYFSAIEEEGWEEGIMKIYLVINEDRHTDVEIKVFKNEDSALHYAQGLIKDYSVDADPEDIKVEEVEGWLFCTYYSCEGDVVYVKESVLHEE